MPAQMTAHSLTVREVIAAYQLHAQANGVHCREAAAQRARVFAEFVATYGDLPVGEAKPYHLTDFINAHPGWRSPATKRGRANAIRAAFAWALDEERITRNPFRRVRYEEAERRPAMPDQTLQSIKLRATKEF